MDPEACAAPCGSVRERTIAENSLVLLLQGLQGLETTVELRNEGVARGRVLSVDAFMNVRLRDATYQDGAGGPAVQLQDLFVTGRNVRYVHIPEQLDVTETIQKQLQQIHRLRTFQGGRTEFQKKK